MLYCTVKSGFFKDGRLITLREKGKPLIAVTDQNASEKSELVLDNFFDNIAKIIFIGKNITYNLNYIIFFNGIF